MKDLVLIDEQDRKILELVMVEYEATMNTVVPNLSALDFAYFPSTYVPNLFDIVNAFPDLQTEEIWSETLRIVHKYHICFRYDLGKTRESYIILPTQEVW